MKFDFFLSNKHYKQQPTTSSPPLLSSLLNTPPYFLSFFKVFSTHKTSSSHAPILSKKSILILSALALNLFLIPSFAQAESGSFYLNKMQNYSSSSVYVEDNRGRTLHNVNGQSGLVPASTIKVFTAFMALEYWGLDHKFHTDTLLDKNQVLWIKGYGDPFLTSEEIQAMAQQVARYLKAKKVYQLNGIMIDDSYFDNVASQLQLPRSLNPYDAPLGAVSANFNSIGYNKKGYSISPIEWQTPVTSMTIELSELTGNGKHRISLRNGGQATRYFQEIFSHMLEQQGINVKQGNHFKRPSSLPVLYRHYNSHPLSEVVQNMLKYSNNFIANQLFLSLGVEASLNKLPASMALSQGYAKHFIKKRFNWNNYFISDGAGLSRETHISTQQMVQLLDAFKPYYYLLPCKNNGQICAKTGTLSDVHSYAGYFVRGQELYPFAIFFAQRMPYRYRNRMAKALYDDLFY